MTVSLVTDSTAYLPAGALSQRRIAVVPLHVVVAGKEYSEGVDISPAQVAAALRRFSPVSTSRPSPQAFLDAYERAARDGADQVVSVHISSAMSSTVGSAQLAAQRSPIPVEVVDSRSMGMAMGYAVMSAADLAATGAPASSVAAQARSRCGVSTVVFYVDTLEHLRRGGRIGAASAFLGSALAIKPILSVRDGAITPLEKVRTPSRALAHLEEIAVRAAQNVPPECDGVDLAVHHLDSAERAAHLAARLTDRLHQAHQAHQVQVVEVGAVVGAHVGPGTVGVAVSPRVPAAQQ